MFKILLIEDDEKEVKMCAKTLERMNKQSSEQVYSIENVNTIDDAREMLDKNCCDASIIDIKLGAYDGYEVVKDIIEKYRIPACVFTGTPDIDEDCPVKTYKKGELGYEEIITKLEKEVSTGLYDVLGGRGIIEREIKNIFWNNLYPSIDTWIKYKDEKIDTEKILLRYAVAHIQEMLDEGPEYCTEEMYVRNVSNCYKTGALFRQKQQNVDYVLLSPPCDLAFHGDGFKSDSLLLCEIEQKKWNGQTKKQIKKVISNSETAYYHWLPDNELFHGGCINFRKVVTCGKTELDEKYEYYNVKIQDQFVKNILNRFSSYYSRQGQPDFRFDYEADIRANRE